MSEHTKLVIPKKEAGVSANDSAQDPGRWQIVYPNSRAAIEAAPLCFPVPECSIRYQASYVASLALSQASLERPLADSQYCLSSGSTSSNDRFACLARDSQPY